MQKLPKATAIIAFLAKYDSIKPGRTNRDVYDKLKQMIFPKGW